MYAPDYRVLFICKGDDEMKVRDHLSTDQRKKLIAVARDNKPPSNHKDWHELMGVNRDTYKRVKGRLRKC
jgi:hypothetical protein